MTAVHAFNSRSIGLALSGGSVRGLAHIGVVKALEEAGLKPHVVAGTSAGSLVGAAVAAGMSWKDLSHMAHSVFWPSLLHGAGLERFCAAHLPSSFSHLHLKFAAVATRVPSRQAVAMTDGDLRSALSASCALGFRRPVSRQGERLKDGGMACVLPAQTCRELGAEVVISSDVWEMSSILRRVGCHPNHPVKGRLYPSHYRSAVRNSDVLIQPSIPASGYIPGKAAVERLIAEGEKATRAALNKVASVPQNGTQRVTA